MHIHLVKFQFCFAFSSNKKNFTAFIKKELKDPLEIILERLFTLDKHAYNKKKENS